MHGHRARQVLLASVLYLRFYMASWFWIAFGLSVLASRDAPLRPACRPMALFRFRAHRSIEPAVLKRQHAARQSLDRRFYLHQLCRSLPPHERADASGANRASDLKELRLVSFTVDPARDTPEVLAKYAGRYQAQPGVWFFLTGTQVDRHKLARNVFMLAM